MCRVKAKKENKNIQQRTLSGFITIRSINYDAPNNDKDITNFLNNPRTILQNENLEDEENIIIGGKINCSLNPALDKKGGTMLLRKSLDLVDI